MSDEETATPIVDTDTKPIKKRVPAKLKNPKKTWDGDMKMFCKLVLHIFEKIAKNLDNTIFKAYDLRSTFEHTDQHDSQMCKVKVNDTARQYEVRDMDTFAPPKKNFAIRELSYLYWGARVERQDLLLAEAFLLAVTRLKEKGYTHIRCDPAAYNDDEALHLSLSLNGFKLVTYNIVPRVAVQVYHMAGQGAWPMPTRDGVPHHFIVHTEHDIAIDLSFAQYDPFVAQSKSHCNKQPYVTVSPFHMFRIAKASDLLHEISFSNELVDLPETPVQKNNPVFKELLEQFSSLVTFDPPQLKESGNTEFAEQKYEPAITYYSVALGSIVVPGEHNDLRHILYSNRATAYYQLKQYDFALDDARQTILIAPTWPKGYLRKAAILNALEKYEEAEKATAKAQALENGDPVPMSDGDQAEDDDEDEEEVEIGSKRKHSARASQAKRIRR